MEKDIPSGEEPLAKITEVENSVASSGNGQACVCDQSVMCMKGKSETYKDDKRKAGVYLVYQ